MADYYATHFGLVQANGSNSISGSPCIMVAKDPESKFSIAFSGHKASLDLGEGFGHFGIAMPDVYKACEKIKLEGGKVDRAVHGTFDLHVVHVWHLHDRTMARCSRSCSCTTCCTMVSWAWTIPW